MRKKGAISLGVILLLFTAATVLAETAMKRFDQRTQTCRPFTLKNAQAGYLSFRAVCKSCHFRENDVGAPFLYTESKTRDGWDRVFAEMYPLCAQDGSWDKLGEEDRQNLHDYLFVEAACSNNPNEVGSCFA